MSYREISGRLGLDEGKVKSYIQNGKRNLRICLETPGKEHPPEGRGDR